MDRASSGETGAGMSGLRKVAKERSLGSAGAQNISSSDLSGGFFWALLKPRSGEESAPDLRVFGPKVFLGADVLLRLGVRSGDEAGARQGSSPNSQLSARGFLPPVNPRPGAEAAPGLRFFLSKGLSAGDFRLVLEGRSEGVAGFRKFSSSNCSDFGFLTPLKARPRGEAASGRGPFWANGLSGDAFRLLVGGRPDVLEGVSNHSSSEFADCGFLPLLKLWPRGEAASAPGRWLFCPKGFSRGVVFRPPGDRPGAEVLLGLPVWLAFDFRFGVFFLKDKGSPQRKKGKK